LEDVLDVLTAFWLAITKRPTMKESMGKPGAFFSGHYGVFGLNVQAVCDIKCRFQFFGLVAPGKCGDQVAFERTPLFQYVKQLPDRYYIIGDAAYSVGEKMLTPFTGGHQFLFKPDANLHRNVVWSAIQQVADPAGTLANLPSFL
jgi:hypothetical protein